MDPQKEDVRNDWFTPVSQQKELVFVQLIDDRNNPGFQLIVQGDTQLYSFTWKRFAAYRTRFEEFGIPFFINSTEIQSGRFPSGATHKVINSSWKKKVQEESGLLDHHHPKAEHFVICMADYVFEVLSNEEPEITTLDELNL